MSHFFLILVIAYDGSPKRLYRYRVKSSRLANASSAPARVSDCRELSPEAIAQIGMRFAAAASTSAIESPMTIGRRQGPRLIFDIPYIRERQTDESRTVSYLVSPCLDLKPGGVAQLSRETQFLSPRQLEVSGGETDRHFRPP